MFNQKIYLSVTARDVKQRPIHNLYFDIRKTAVRSFSSNTSFDE